MPLETGTYVTELVSTNPTVSDGLNQGDDHIRLIKSAVKATLPNFTAAPLNSTQAQIDGAVAAITGASGSALLMTAASGIAVAGDTDTALYSPGEDQLSLKVNGLDAVKVKADKSVEFTGAATVDGALAATGPISGPGVVPIGGTIVWWTDTLPAGAGTWAWANGGTYLRSNTALWSLFGTTFGIGDGTTTANLPDLRDNVPVGKGTMGATSAAGRITNFVTSTIGNLFGECLHLLGIPEIPSHNHTLTDPGHVHEELGSLVNITNGGSTISQVGSAGASPGQNTASATTGITLANTGGGASHNNVQPAIVCNWIVRTA